MSSQYQGTSSRPFTSSYFRPQHSTFNERAKKNIGRDDLRSRSAIELARHTMPTSS
ncbi:hypothetical protein IG631_06330 [Alternaria alternata]|nr:hypothetical protein IG631_06330 [Alternaria alternata]